MSNLLARKTFIKRKCSLNLFFYKRTNCFKSKTRGLLTLTEKELAQCCVTTEVLFVKPITVEHSARSNVLENQPYHQGQQRSYLPTLF